VPSAKQDTSGKFHSSRITLRPAGLHDEMLTAACMLADLPKNSSEASSSGYTMEVKARAFMLLCPRHLFDHRAFLCIQQAVDRLSKRILLTIWLVMQGTKKRGINATKKKAVMAAAKEAALAGLNLKK